MSDFTDEVWRTRKDAHQIHHRIADFILHKDAREHPPGLRNLVKKYRAMMEEADALDAARKARTP